MRPARILAVTVSAVLGVLGGVGAGVLLDQHEAGQDPLGLGVTLVNQPCTGEVLLVTGWGTTSESVGPGISSAGADGHYLQVDRSCPTAWRPRGPRTDGYVAYLGPYTTARDACAERVTRRGSFVTRLDQDSQRAVQCLCYLDDTTLPTLTPGMVVDAAAGIYVRALQDLLVSMHKIPPDHVTGLYDPITVRAIRSVQKEAALPQDGVLEPNTWHTLVNDGC